MKDFEIENVKKATKMMFVDETFDRFLLAEATISVMSTYNIDGRINKKFLPEEEQEKELENEYIKWAEARKICFEIIKGKKTPTSFKFVYKLPKEYIDGFLKRNKIGDVQKEDINALFMNMKFDGEKLICVTGTSLKTFSLGNRDVEEAWDKEIGEFIAKINSDAE